MVIWSFGVIVGWQHPPYGDGRDIFFLSQHDDDDDDDDPNDDGE